MELFGTRQGLFFSVGNTGSLVQFLTESGSHGRIVESGVGNGNALLDIALDERR
jgi:hypothetical protein